MVIPMHSEMLPKRLNGLSGCDVARVWMVNTVFCFAVFVWAVEAQGTVKNANRVAVDE